MKSEIIIFDEQKLLDYKTTHGHYPDYFGRGGETITRVVKREPTLEDHEAAVAFETCPRCQSIKNDPELWAKAHDFAVVSFAQLLPEPPTGYLTEEGQKIYAPFAGTMTGVWFPPENPLEFWVRCGLHKWCVNNALEKGLRS